MGRDMAAADLSFSSLRTGYQKLPEEEKRALSKDVAAKVPEFFRDWTIAAGLAKGYRAKTVAERKDPRCREKLDEALLRESEAKLLEFAARRFFLFIRPRFVARLRAVAAERDATHDPERMDQLLEALRAELGAEPEWHFFEAAVRRRPETFLLPGLPVATDAEAADAEAMDGEDTHEAPADESRDEPEDYLAVWKAEFENLQTECNELERMIPRLRAAQLVDLDLLHAALDKAFRTGSALREKLKERAVESGFVFEGWQDAAELQGYVDALASHLGDEAGTQASSRDARTSCRAARRDPNKPSRASQTGSVDRVEGSRRRRASRRHRWA